MTLNRRHPFKVPKPEIRRIKVVLLFKEGAPQIS